MIGGVRYLDTHPVRLNLRVNHLIDWSLWKTRSAFKLAYRNALAMARFMTAIFECIRSQVSQSGFGDVVVL